jgi:preprotein translocase subunit SecY
MKKSKTIISLRAKVMRIATLLFLIRLGFYIPVPNIDLDVLLQCRTLNPMFGFARTLAGSSFLSLGSLGILPYVNSSVIIQLLTAVVPTLKRLQKEEGELGRQEISRYTRYLTFLVALLQGTAIAFFLVKPVVFNWNLTLVLKIVVSLTTGSLLTMWFAELITEEGLGNGYSMIVSTNIIGNIPSNFGKFIKSIGETSYLNIMILFGKIILIYFFIVGIIIIFQNTYKKITIISAKQLSINSFNQSNELRNSYIPIKLNQSGIMPIVFSSNIITFLYYPLQRFADSVFGLSLKDVPIFVKICSVLLNIFLIISLNRFYSLLILKPNDISQNLAKMAYSIPGIRQGNQTTQYLKQTITRVAFIGGLFLVFLAFLPTLIENIFKLSIFKNVTSLFILISVAADITSQIRGYLIARNYEIS